MAPRRSTQNDPQGMVDRNSRVAIAAAGFGVMYSGLYDVSAASGQTLSPIGQGIFPIAPELLTLRQHPMHDLIAKHKAVKQRRSNMYRDQCKQHPRQDSMDVPHRVSECGTCRGQAGEWHDA